MAIEDETGSLGVYTPDRSVTGTLGALNATLTIRLTGRGGAGGFITTANLSATAVGEFSFDGGTTWHLGVLNTGSTTASSLVFSGISTTLFAGILHQSGATHARFRISVYTSGTATGYLSASDSPGHHRNVTGLVDTREIATSATNVTSVAASVTSVTLIAAGIRRQVLLYNDSTSVCHVKLGTTASATDFTIKLFADGYYEPPYAYAGRIDGIWDAAVGSMRVTELT
jgi:hypothetical protein